MWCLVLVMMMTRFVVASSTLDVHVGRLTGHSPCCAPVTDRRQRLSLDQLLMVVEMVDVVAMATDVASVVIVRMQVAVDEGVVGELL